MLPYFVIFPRDFALLPGLPEPLLRNFLRRKNKKIPETFRFRGFWYAVRDSNP